MNDGPTARLDISANRQSRKWTRREQAGRVAWALARPLFALSPRPLWGWRRWLLRRFGARIGADVHLHPTVRIIIPWNLEIANDAGIGDRATLYALGPIRIGRAATVSQGAHLCAGTHDHTHPALPLIKSPIEIGAQAWVCADAFVGPDMKVGEGAIIGARGVAVKDVPAWTIVAGNPARVIGERRLRPVEGQVQEKAVPR